MQPISRYILKAFAKKTENLKCIAFHRHFGMRVKRMTCECFHLCSLCLSYPRFAQLQLTHALGCGFQYSFFAATIHHHILFYVGETCMSEYFPSYRIHRTEKTATNTKLLYRGRMYCLRYVFQKNCFGSYYVPIFLRAFAVDVKPFLTFEWRWIADVQSWNPNSEHINGHYISKWRLGFFFHIVSNRKTGGKKRCERLFKNCNSPVCPYFRSNRSKNVLSFFTLDQKTQPFSIYTKCARLDRWLFIDFTVRPLFIIHGVGKRFALWFTLEWIKSIQWQ